MKQAAGNEQQAMDEVSFGFRNVGREEKAPLVREVFDKVAARYDVMNDLMSFGLHRWWKREMVAQLSPRPRMKVLDLAGGTGDIAFRIRKKFPQSEVMVCDINAAMLHEGWKRAVDRNLLTGLEWACANAEALPFPDAQFDAVTIAFGIRNVTDIPKALAEIYRVLKPGGHFLCLEFSHVPMEPVKKIYDAYSFHIVPHIGKAVVGDDAPYQYLVESIRRFPKQKTFMRMIEEAGMSRVTFRNLQGGVVAIHSGWRI